MKKIVYSLSILSMLLCFTSCPFFPRPEPVTDPLFLYTVEATISNESSSEKSFMTDAYILYGNNSGQKIYSCNSVQVFAQESDTYSKNICLDACAEPHLSHIIKIDGKNYAGFDTNTCSIFTTSSDEVEQIQAEKINLGSVDWTQGEYPIVNYEGKSFNAPEGYRGIKLLYSITIKDEADILEEEKADYINGVKITVSHSFQ